jgi:hypothetical protein
MGTANLCVAGERKAKKAKMPVEGIFATAKPTQSEIKCFGELPLELNNGLPSVDFARDSKKFELPEEQSTSGRRGVSYTEHLKQILDLQREAASREAHYMDERKKMLSIIENLSVQVSKLTIKLASLEKSIAVGTSISAQPITEMAYMKPVVPKTPTVASVSKAQNPVSSGMKTGIYKSVALKTAKTVKVAASANTRITKKSSIKKPANASSLKKKLGILSEEQLIRIAQGKSAIIQEKCQLLYFEGLKQNRISLVRLALEQLGAPKRSLRNIDFIGKSILELLVPVSAVEAVLSAVKNWGGFHIVDYNPLCEFTPKDWIAKVGEKATSPKAAFEQRFKRATDSVIRAGSRAPRRLLSIIGKSTVTTIRRFTHPNEVVDAASLTTDGLETVGPFN